MTVSHHTTFGWDNTKTSVSMSAAWLIAQAGWSGHGVPNIEGLFPIRVDITGIRGGPRDRNVLRTNQDVMLRLRVLGKLIAEIPVLLMGRLSTHKLRTPWPISEVTDVVEAVVVEYTGDPPFVWELGYSIVWGPKSCGPEMSVPQRNHEAE